MRRVANSMGVPMLKWMHVLQCVHSWLYTCSDTLCLYVATRPDIAHAVSKGTEFSANPITYHWTAVKWITRYLRSTTKLDLLFKSQGIGDYVGYSDADLGSDFDD